MVLPEICPLNNELHCKGKECHLFHVDWRTGEENCTIGYRSSHRQGNHSDIISDTYAEETRMRLGYNPQPPLEWPSERQPIQSEVRQESEPVKLEYEKVEEEIIPPEPEIQEEIVMETEYTTVIHSHEAAMAEEVNEDIIDASGKEDDASKKKFDKIMGLDDIPDDYEKEFWN